MSFSLGTMVALCSSCAMLDDRLEPQTTDEVLKQVQTKERLELEAAVRRRLSHISGLLAEGKLDTAEELLLPLTRHEFCRNEVKLLHDQLMLARRRLEVDFQGSETSARMHREVDDKLTLPGNYGKTIVIDSSLDPLELPQGKMEDLINRKVSMALENASVGTIVDFLNENGLNVIADDALLGDKPETKTLTLKVNDVPLKEIFSYIARNMGIAFYIGENLVWITAGEETSGPKLETRILRLRQGFVPSVPQGGGAPGATTGGGGGAPQVEDTELADVLEAFLEGSPEGSSYQIFKTRNILVIRNTRENIRFVEQILHEFDKPPLQVVIEARFVTVSSGDLKDVGVQISQTEQTGTRDHDRGESGIRGHEANFLTSLGQLDEANGMGALTLSGVIGRRLFDVVIQAIENKESSVTLSVPRVTVMNNRSARIRKGTKIYYFDEYELSTIDRGDNGTEERLVPSGDPTELPLGLTFDVNVNIGNDGRTVLLGLHPEIVEFIAWEDYLTTGDDDDDSSSSDSGTGLTQVKLPRTHEQSVMTTVGVQSGETVVLGGMIEQSKKHTVKKIPLLGDLPLIGWLFRRTTTENEPVNLLIFVTATVINDRGEYVRTRAEGEALPSAK